MTYAFIILGFVVGAGVGWFGAISRYGQTKEFVSEDEEIMQEAREAVVERTNKRFDKIMLVAEEAGRITNDGVEELFCISDRTASSYLRKLTKAGRLKKHGGGRSTYYTPTK